MLKLVTVEPMPRTTRKRKPVFDLRQRRIIRDTARKVFEEKFKGKESPQKKMALALDLSQTSISALLAGTYVPSVQVAEDIAILAGFESIKDLVGPYYHATEDENPPSSGPSLSSHAYPNLTKCIDFHGKDHWPAYVIAAAKAGYYEDDVPPKEWTARLDALQKLLKSRE
jgi:hypothetical protein